MRKTKIICTLGPSTDDERILTELMRRGMNVARFNFSHQSHDKHLERLETLRRVREELDLPVAALLDTRGPEVRVKTFREGKVYLKEGDNFILTTDEVEGTDKIVSITEEEYINYLTSRKVTFDANGGVLGTETNYKMVPYNGVMGELPYVSCD